MKMPGYTWNTNQLKVKKIKPLETILKIQIRKK